jgi:hypothetical protein
MATHFEEVKEMAGSLQETLGVSNEQVLATYETTTAAAETPSRAHTHTHSLSLCL